MLADIGLVTKKQLTVALERVEAKKQDKLTFDSTPTTGSNNPVTSDGVAKYVDNAIGAAIGGSY